MEEDEMEVQEEEEEVEKEEIKEEEKEKKGKGTRGTGGKWILDTAWKGLGARHHAGRGRNLLFLDSPPYIARI